MKHHLITLVKLINNKADGDLTAIDDLTAVILENSLGQSSTVYLSLLYRLIFHAFKYNPSAACRILSGFIQFGHTAEGVAYKPLLDYFAIEAFNELYNMFGWTIVKPCVTALRDTNTNYLKEPLFNHILNQIGVQLNEDKNDIPYSSDLCYNLPREKSFSWGWFSYDLVRYYCGMYTNTTTTATNKAKQLRKNMMFYRKLLTELRRNTLENPVVILNRHDPISYTGIEAKIEEKWEDILSALAEYKWASDIIEKVINVEDGEEEEEAQPLEKEEAEPLEEEESEPLEEEGVEGAQPLAQPLEESEPLEKALEAPLEESEPLEKTLEAPLEESEPLEKTLEAPLEKKEGVEGGTPLVEGGQPLNKGWFSWLGWS
jgi:hypothetical protein